MNSKLLCVMLMFSITLASCGGGSAGSPSTTSTADTSAPSSIGSTTVIASIPSFLPPARFDSLIKASYSPPSLTLVNTFVTRGRYLISDFSSTTLTANYLTIGSTALSADPVYGTNTGYAVTTSNLNGSSTIHSYLSSLLLVVSNSDGSFRLESQLHPNHAIDYNLSTKVLKFSNNFGLISSTTNGYITFIYNPITHFIQAQKRYVYSLSSTTSTTNPSTTWTESDALDGNFTAANYYISLSNGVYSLVASTSNATPFYLYNSPLDFGIPADFNPNGTAYVPNSPAPFLQKIYSVSSIESSTSNSSIYNQLKTIYRPQVLYSGSNATTKASADAMLTSIVSSAQSNGFNLRYSPASILPIEMQQLHIHLLAILLLTVYLASI